MEPLYLRLSEREWKSKIMAARSMLKNCSVCARKCGVNRLKGETGACRSGKELKINSAFPHFGEESELVGVRGSGAIFNSNCNLSCVFCQNWEISQKGEGRIVSRQEAAEMMLALQEQGCHNINWVSPSHFVPQLLESLYLARKQGLNIPVVYNTGGYDNIDTIKLLKDVIDIYMPDIKYGTNEAGLKYSGIPNYFDVAREAVKEMHRQVGDLKISQNGIAERGLLVRHLVLPNRIAESENVLRFLAQEISKNTYINIMLQYRPCYRAHHFEELNRTPAEKEYRDVILKAVKLGLKRGFL
jgi:putative pyruvate formate lyase activating enzyme